MTTPASKLAARIAVCFAAILSGAPVAAQTSPAHSDVVQADSLEGIPRLPPAYRVHALASIEVAFPATMEPLLRATIPYLDADIRTIAAHLGLASTPTLRLRIVPDTDALRALAPSNAPPPAYASGVAYPGLRLALVSAREPIALAATDVRRVSQHEIAHLLLEDAVGGTPIPRWFSEGIAVQLSAERQFERFRTLAWAAFTRRLVHLRDLDEAFAASGDRVDLAYAEATDVLDWLVRTRGPERFRGLLARMRSGDPFDVSFAETYGQSLRQLELEWRDDAEGRFLMAPLWASSGALWTLAAALLVVGFLRLRARSRSTLERWRREEAGVDGPRARAFTTGLRGSLGEAPNSDGSVLP